MDQKPEDIAGEKGKPIGYNIGEDGSATLAANETEGPTFHDVGGLKEQEAALVKLVIDPVKYKKLFDEADLERTHGILIHGPHGTGKTLLAHALKNEAEKSAMEIMYVDSYALYSQDPEKTESVLLRGLSKLKGKKDAVLIIDNIDLIAPDPSRHLIDTGSSAVVSAFLQHVMEDDEDEEYNGLMIIGITSEVGRVNPSLRGDGKFEKEIEIKMPDERARAEIIDIQMRKKPKGKDFNPEKIAALTHGYSGADIHELLKEASLIAVNNAIRRGRTGITDSDVKITQAHVLGALKIVKPKTLKDVVADVPDVKWSDVGGLDKVKKELLEAVELPLTEPEAFERFGIRPVKGILLYGPPGTGKTLLAKAVANRCKANFISVKATELFNKFVGESEARMRKVFEQARGAAPCIVFIDEIDTIGRNRSGGSYDGGVGENVLNALLTELDGFKELKDIIIMGATNRPDLLDPALTRSGRFDKLIELPMPDETSRMEIFKVHTSKKPIGTDVDLGILAASTGMYNGADIENVCREAGMIAMRKKGDAILMGDFLEALKKIKPSVDSDRIKGYKLSLRDREPLGFTKQPSSRLITRL